MPTRDIAPLGAPCWIDLMTSDPDLSRAFYGELFGWTSEEAGEEYGGYINFFREGVHVAGAMRNDPSWGAPDVWSVYLAVADAPPTADAAAANGGSVMVPPMAVTTLGTMAVLTDPGGAAIGLWQPGDHKGFGVLDEPGSPSWFELHTRDYDAAVPFYEKVFDWDTHTMGDTPEFRYTTLGEGESQLAGIMDSSAWLPEDVPAHWAVYFAVDDTDASLAATAKLGGSTLVPAEDTPYGRIAVAADPTGAPFRLRSNA